VFLRNTGVRLKDRNLPLPGRRKSVCIRAEQVDPGVSLCAYILLSAHFDLTRLSCLKFGVVLLSLSGNCCDTTLTGT
jgi:hypothetical protein